MPACVCMRVCERMYVCVRACVHACVFVRAYVCVRESECKVGFVMMDSVRVQFSCTQLQICAYVYEFFANTF